MGTQAGAMSPTENEVLALVHKNQAGTDFHVLRFCQTLLHFFSKKILHTIVVCSLQLIAVFK